MKTFTRIEDFMAVMDLEYESNFIKRIKKGGGAFGFVMLIACFKDGEFTSTTLKLVKSLSAEDKTNYDFNNGF